jgi:hypothetical protein
MTRFKYFSCSVAHTVSRVFAQICKVFISSFFDFHLRFVLILYHSHFVLFPNVSVASI